MKTGYKIILVLAMVTAVLSSLLPCRAAEKDDIWREDRAAPGPSLPDATEEAGFGEGDIAPEIEGDRDIWREDKAAIRPQRLELTDERIERIMNRLKENEPQEAQRLAKLREEDPNKFKDEIRKTVHRRFGERMQARGARGFGQGAPVAGPEGHIRGQEGMRIREREHLEWLKKNYPEEARELVELSRRNPELYARRLDVSSRKYRRIMEASEENPELANVLKEELELRRKRDELMRKIRTAGEKDKAGLVKELEAVVGSQFDLIVKQRQLRYEQMCKRLERLEKQVQEGKAEVEKWKSAEFKGKTVKERVEELISKTEKFNWD